MAHSLFQNPQEALKTLTLILRDAKPGADDYFAQLKAENLSLDLCKSYPDLVLNLVLTYFDKGDVITHYYPSSNPHSKPSSNFPVVMTLLTILREHLNATRIIDSLKVHAHWETQFILLNELADVIYKNDDQVQYRVLLPLVLRSCAMILHQYLNLAQEKTYGASDRPPLDVLLCSVCESEVQRILLKYLHTAGVKVTSNPEARRFLLNFLCDMAEALLQNIFEAKLKPEILTDLLSQATNTIKKYYDPLELTEVYLQVLKANNFKHPDKVLEVPEAYESSHLLSGVGYPFYINMLLKNSNLRLFYTRKTMLSILIPAVGESLKRSFPHKKPLTQMLSKLVAEDKAGLVYESVAEYGYPLYLLANSLLKYPLSEDSAECDNLILAIPAKLDLLVLMIKHSEHDPIIEDFVLRSLSKLSSCSGWKIVLKDIIMRNNLEHDELVLSALERIDKEDEKCREWLRRQAQEYLNNKNCAASVLQGLQKLIAQ